MNRSAARLRLHLLQIEDGSDERIGRRTQGEEAANAPVVESNARSILKALSWRTTASIDTFLVAFLVTGRLKLALSIGGLELFTKLALYYGHERVWNKVSFGRARVQNDYEI
jgi:uncharacterized membrane protein